MRILKSKLFINSTPQKYNFPRTAAINSTTIETNKGTYKKANTKSLKDVPGLSSLPIIGQLHHFFPGGVLYNTDLNQKTKYMYENYGRIVRLNNIMGNRTTIFLFDPDAIAHVLRNENWLPMRPGMETLYYYRKYYDKDHDPNKSIGLIVDDGEKWKTFRTAVNPILMQPKSLSLYNSILDEISLELINRIKSLRDENNVIKNNFDFEINMWALETTGAIALGSRLNCFDPNLPKDSPVLQLANVLRDILRSLNELEMKPHTWRYFTTANSHFRRAMKLYETQKNLAKYFIDKAKKESIQTRGPDTAKGVLERLLEIDEHIANVMASDMLFGAIDSNSSSIIALLYLLAINPEKQNKLREEVMSQNESKPYLKACLKEASRIMPVALGNGRISTKDIDVLGYTIPKDTGYIFAHHYLCMLEEQFPKPTEYIPERWLVDKEDPLYYGNAHPFAYMPFGFGVRSCIGRRLAELMMGTLIKRIVENFEVKWFGPPLKRKQVLINVAVEPFNFIFNDVKNV